jgi:hypothetical protein
MKVASLNLCLSSRPKYLAPCRFPGQVRPLFQLATIAPLLLLHYIASVLNQKEVGVEVERRC